MAWAVKRLTRPMGPAPQIKTVLPKATPARWHACTPTAKGSIRAPSSRLTLSGNLKQKSAASVYHLLQIQKINHLKIVIFQTRDRSLTMWTKFCPFLTTYLALVDDGITLLVIRANLHTIDISSTISQPTTSTQLKNDPNKIYISPTEVAVIGWGCTKLHFWTQIVTTIFAVVAHSTRNSRFNGYAISGFQVFNIPSTSKAI